MQLKRRSLTTVSLVLACGLLFGASAFAQTTGRIVGTIVDAQQAVLPGVTVTATSPQLQGANTAVTDANGQYRFPALPPGSYDLKAELQGFKPFAQQNVRVNIDQTVTLNMTLAVAGVAETVNVQGTSPVIDTTSTASGISAGKDVFEQLPVRRDIYAVTRIAPGVTQDFYGPSFYGSSSAENQYIIDGLNTTGVATGVEGKTLNFDFVQEVEIKTGGLNAEYGRLTGGAVNVLTKSGGNAFHGDVFGFGEGGKLQATNTTAAELSRTNTTTLNTARRGDFGGDLGGFLVKDKVWFFVAYDRDSRRDEYTVFNEPTPTPVTFPALNSVYPSEVTRNLFSTKLTYKATQNHTLSFSVIGDPSKREGRLFAIQGPPSTFNGTLDTGSTDLVGRYEGVLTSNTLLTAIVGRHREKQQYSGPGTSIPRTSDNTLVPAAFSGGFSYFENSDYNRYPVKADLTQYWHEHSFKFGGDYEKISSTIDRFAGGAGQRLYKYQKGGVIYYRHRYYIQPASFDRSNLSTWAIADPLVATPVTKNASIYGQDSWRVFPGFTANLGIRWEQQHVLGQTADSGFTLKKNWAPRLGFVYDPTNNGKAKVYANWGRFYENIPQDINIRAFGGEITAFAYNFSPDPSNFLPVAGTPGKNSTLGGTTEPVDPNLKGQYIDEWQGGAEFEVMPNTTAGFRVIHRNLGRVIEDFLVPSEGNYFIANPGEGTLGKTLAFYDGVSTAPAPKAERKNTSVELTLRKRFSRNWQFIGSYVWSKLEGNYDGTYQSSTGQLDPNINSAFDYADFMVNNVGPLTGQRKHQVKLDGSYVVGSGALNGLNVGASFHWFSGLPLTAYGYSFAYANWEYYLTPRGSLGTGPSDYEMDLHLSYPVKVGTARANLIMDVFNAFNRQAITQLDQRYNLDSDEACAGIPGNLCNGDGGLLALPNTITAATQLANPRATATNPDFLKKGQDTNSFTLPRSIRLGVRFTF